MTALTDPYVVAFDTATWSHAWACTQPGCHDHGDGYDTTHQALVVAQAHADTHAVTAAVRAGW